MTLYKSLKPFPENKSSTVTKLHRPIFLIKTSFTLLGKEICPSSTCKQTGFSLLSSTTGQTLKPVPSPTTKY